MPSVRFMIWSDLIYDLARTSEEGECSLQVEVATKSTNAEKGGGFNRSHGLPALWMNMP